MNKSPTKKIIMRLVDDPAKFGKQYCYKTLKGAQKGAARLVSDSPRKDPDGYAVSPTTGNCLFFVTNCDFESIFPVSAVMNS